DELAAAAWAFASGVDGAAVHFDQATHECQANAKSTLSTIETTLSLRERVEDARKHFGRDANSVIADRNDRFLPVTPQVNGKLAASVVVVGGVGEHIDQYMPDPRGISVRPECIWNEGEGQLMACVFDLRPDRLNRSEEQFFDFGRAALDLHLPLVDARDIEQV